MIERADKGLAFMLQYENVAWYEQGTVRILDRRIYPIKEQFVVCKDYREVAQAIRDMVTQSAGPYTAAAMGMALAAYECRNMTAAEQEQPPHQFTYIGVYTWDPTPDFYDFFKVFCLPERC